MDRSEGGNVARPPRTDVGKIGEKAALAWYRRRGYRLVDRNWRCPLGEIDLVLARAGTLVFCEVKTRRTDAFGGPFDAVTWRKKGKLRSLAEAFLAASLLKPNAIRFDVASVIAVAPGRPSVHVFEHAF